MRQSYLIATIDVSVLDNLFYSLNNQQLVRSSNECFKKFAVVSRETTAN